MIEKDILVIGAGPAGISAGVYLSRSKYSFSIIEKSAIGGKLNIISTIENYPGMASTNGHQLIADFQKQIDFRDINILSDNVVGIKKENDYFLIYGDNDEYKCKAIIISTGSEILKTGVKGEKEYQGKGISYCSTCDGFFYKNKDIVVFANNVKSYKEAIYLESIVNKIYLLNDNDVDDNEGHLAKLISSPKVQYYPYHIIDEYIGDENGITSIKAKSLKDGSEQLFSCYGVFPYVGEAPSNSFINSLELKHDKGYLVVDENMKTSMDGIYACGDIVSKPLKQIVTAANDGAIAATSVIRYLNMK